MSFILYDTSVVYLVLLDLVDWWSWVDSKKEEEEKHARMVDLENIENVFAGRRCLLKTIHLILSFSS